MVISIFLEDLERCSVCDPAQYNSMKKKSKYADLAQENGFGSA